MKWYMHICCIDSYRKQHHHHHQAATIMPGTPSVAKFSLHSFSSSVYFIFFLFSFLTYFALSHIMLPLLWYCLRHTGVKWRWCSEKEHSDWIYVELLLYGMEFDNEVASSPLICWQMGSIQTKRKILRLRVKKKVSVVCTDRTAFSSGSGWLSSCNDSWSVVLKQR